MDRTADEGRGATDAVAGAKAPLGRLLPPYPYDHCASVDCDRPLVTADDAAFLFKDQDSGKLVMFCEDCAFDVELNYPLRFKLVAL